MKDQWLQLGTVGRPQGLNGAFGVSGREEAWPAELREVRIGPKPDTAPTYRLSGLRHSGGRPILLCAEIESREAADLLKLQPIWCLRSQLHCQEATEYLWADLVGRSVLDSEGVELGLVVAVGNFGASDIVRIQSAAGSFLELPLVAAYCDMSFTSASTSLRLTVAAEVFSDSWQPS